MEQTNNDITYIPYNDIFRTQCYEMMKPTWHFNKLFEGVRDEDAVYKLFLDMSVMESSYTQLALDSDGTVLGYIMGASTKAKTHVIPKLKLGAKIAYEFLSGVFGNRLHALSAIKRMTRDLTEVMKDKKNYGVEISLFFVSEKARGRGVGKTLMNRFMEYHGNHGVKDIILMTDDSCNFEFYDHYGFKRINTVPTLTPSSIPEGETIGNMYAYAYTL